MNTTVTVLPFFASVLPFGLFVITDTAVTTGATLSIVNPPATAPAVAFPARSVMSTVIVYAPAVSPPATTCVHVYVLPVFTGPANASTGNGCSVGFDSSASPGVSVYVSVLLSPAGSGLPPELDTVGAVKSYVTLPMFCTVTFPAASVVVTVDVFSPSVSPEIVVRVYVNVHGPLPAFDPNVIACPPSVTVGFAGGFSFTVNFAVTTSPSFASVLFALFDVTLTGVTTGATVSIVHPVPARPGLLFPAISVKSTVTAYVPSVAAATALLYVKLVFVSLTGAPKNPVCSTPPLYTCTVGRPGLPVNGSLTFTAYSIVSPAL